MLTTPALQVGHFTAVTTNLASHFKRVESSEMKSPALLVAALVFCSSSVVASNSKGQLQHDTGLKERPQTHPSHNGKKNIRNHHDDAACPRSSQFKLCRVLLLQVEIGELESFTDQQCIDPDGYVFALRGGCETLGLSELVEEIKRNEKLSVYLNAKVENFQKDSAELLCSKGTQVLVEQHLPVHAQEADAPTSDRQLRGRALASKTGVNSVLVVRATALDLEVTAQALPFRAQFSAPQQSM